MDWTRRDVVRLALAGVAVPWASPQGLSASQGTSTGVRLGVQTFSYSSRGVTDPRVMLRSMQSAGISIAEMMFNHVEALAGAPVVILPGGNGRLPDSAMPPPGTPLPAGRGGMPQATPAQVEAQVASRAAMRQWRLSSSPATWRPVRDICRAAGIDLHVVCYNMPAATTNDDEIEYAFQMAKGVGAQVISSSTQISMAKRVAPFAERHQIKFAFHGGQSTQPDEVSSGESYLAACAVSKWIGANFDVGHFVASNYDPIAFLKAHHAVVTHLHLKDEKRNHGGLTPWGEGDVPIRAILQLAKQSRWTFPINIEFEYPGDPLVEIPKLVRYCQDALA